MGHVRVFFPELNRELRADKGDNLLELMRKQGIPIAADCGGVGHCGRCRVIVDGKSCLACMTYVLKDTEVSIPTNRINEGYEILSDYREMGRGGGFAGADMADIPTKTTESKQGYGIAVDLGTTTVVGKLIDLSSGLEIGSFAQLNSQQTFGADVISRINVALEDASNLSGLITTQIDALIASLLRQHHISRKQVVKCVIAGNTTMSYLLLDLPCRSLGAAPFTPEFKIAGPYPYEKVFHAQTLHCDCDILPFISSFVGGDLTAGLCSLRYEDDFILMDMGTNGEIVFKRGDRLLATATAAGPAFEGGGVECGSGSIRGAISAISYQDRAFLCRTIGTAPARSICGSGILDLMAILLKQGFIDSTGFLSKETTVNGRVVLVEGDTCSGKETIFFTQRDVRQFQLAKSAIRTGIEVLCTEMGGELPKRVFLAGGFGQSLNPESAITTGLIPESFRGRVFSVGNSCLNGVVKLCLDESLRADVSGLIERGQEINLATHHLFSDLFMEHMTF